MPLDQNVRKKIANAKTGGAGTRLKAGSYVLLVKRILADKKFGGHFLIPECDIEVSDVLEEDTTPNKAGTDASFAWGLDKSGKEGEAALGNIKQFFCALLGWDENMDPEELMEKIGSYCGDPKKPEDKADIERCRGMRVLCVTKRKTIQSGKNAGKQGDFPYFTHIAATDGNSPEEIAARRAELDAKKR